MRIEAEVHVHYHVEEASSIALAAIKTTLDHITHSLEKILATLDDVIQDMTDETTAIGGISTLITGLQQQLADALSGVTLPPGTQAKIDQIFTAAEANKAALATALATGVPPTPTP